MRLWRTFRFITIGFLLFSYLTPTHATVLNDLKELQKQTELRVAEHHHTESRIFYNLMIVVAVCTPPIGWIIGAVERPHLDAANHADSQRRDNLALANIQQAIEFLESVESSYLEHAMNNSDLCSTKSSCSDEFLKQLIALNVPGTSFTETIENLHTERERERRKNESLSESSNDNIMLNFPFF